MTDLLADLNEKQREVVRATAGPVLVLAGAGSGKTRALTHRIAYLIQQKIASPEEILAVTFTNKAASEMRERAAQLADGATPGTIGTFHSLGARILREQAHHLSRSHGFIICDTSDSERLIRQAMENLNISKKEHSPRQLKARLSSEKGSGRTYQDLAQSIMSAQDEVLAAVWARYEKLLAKHDAYDFDDLLIEPLKLLRDQAQVRDLYQRRWRYLSVDEYQDTNPPQEELLRYLTGKEENICVVGDDYQAIYSWRGARVDHILKFEKRYPKCKTIYLTQNYRSTPNILQIANCVIAQNKQQKHKKLWTEQTNGEPVRIMAMPSNRHEATWVRQQLEMAVEAGNQRRDYVVLYRTNAQSRSLEEEFLTHQIPYTIVGGFRFYERREVKDALAFLQLWVNPTAYLALSRIAESLFTGIGPKTLSRWEGQSEKNKQSIQDVLREQGSRRPTVAKVAQAFEAASQQEFTTVADLLKTLIRSSGYEMWLKRQADGEERWENIEELFNVTSAYAEPEKFLQDVALLSDIDQLEDEHDRVTCMTLHAAKGLEYQYVFLIGCEDGLLPHKNSLNKAADLEEERRLLYVGMTRAKRGLAITHARSRFMYGEMVPQIPSRFLKDLPASVEQHEVGLGSSWPDSSGVKDFGLLDGPSDEPVLIDAEEGDFVAHKSFGRGVVIAINGSVVTCVFERFGVKQISADSLSTSENSQLA